MSQDRAFVSVSAADSPSALSILLLQSSLSRLFILLPLFRRLHRLMYRISGLRQMSHRQLNFLSGYETSWQDDDAMPAPSGCVYSCVRSGARMRAIH